MGNPMTKRDRHHRSTFHTLQTMLQKYLARSVVLLTCALLGVGLVQLGHAGESLTTPHALAASPSPPHATKQAAQIEGTVDPVPPELELGHQLYLENCATCHVGVPPAVLPQQTWVDLLQEPQHYGVQLQPLVDPGRLLIWQYVQQFSRTLNEDERVPYRLRNSRFFKALHPKVEFDEPIQLRGCVSCHPAAPQFNYRRLSLEWQDAP